jgi:hypothetical protein
LLRSGSWAVSRLCLDMRRSAWASSPMSDLGSI